MGVFSFSTRISQSGSYGRNGAEGVVFAANANIPLNEWEQLLHKWGKDGPLGFLTSEATANMCPKDKPVNPAMNQNALSLS